MIIEWQGSAFTQYQNYYGIGVVWNWSSATGIGRRRGVEQGVIETEMAMPLVIQITPIEESVQFKGM